MVNYCLYGFVLNTVVGLNNYNAPEKINKKNNNLKNWIKKKNTKMSRNNLLEDFFLIHIRYSTQQWHA